MVAWFNRGPLAPAHHSGAYNITSLGEVDPYTGIPTLSPSILGTLYPSVQDLGALSSVLNVPSSVRAGGWPGIEAGSGVGSDGLTAPCVQGVPCVRAGQHSQNTSLAAPELGPAAGNVVGLNPAARRQCSRPEPCHPPTTRPNRWWCSKTQPTPAGSLTA